MYCSIQYYIILYLGGGLCADTCFLATGKNQAPRLGEVSIFERWKHRAAVKVTIFDDAERLAVAHPLPQEAFACKGNRLFCTQSRNAGCISSFFFVHRPVKESTSPRPGARVLKTEHGADEKPTIKTWCCLSSSGKANATFFVGTHGSSARD